MWDDIKAHSRGPMREWLSLTHPAKRTGPARAPAAPRRPATSWKRSDIPKNEMAFNGLRGDRGGTLELARGMEDRLEEKEKHAWTACERARGEGAFGS